jgi:hypothetical protein
VFFKIDVCTSPVWATFWLLILALATLVQPNGWMTWRWSFEVTDHQYSWGFLPRNTMIWPSKRSPKMLGNILGKRSLIWKLANVSSGHGWIPFCSNVSHNYCVSSYLKWRFP